eukprot:g4254.t1
MPKSRFSSVDVAAACPEILAQIGGMRVSNVYDIDPKTYLLKMQKDGGKQMLLLQSGVRMHLTKFVRDKPTMPSPFAMKLRKHLRTRRVQNCTQLGTDRIIDFEFGSGEAAYHLILELYDKGNVILTNFEYQILAALRSHKFDAAEGAEASDDAGSIIAVGRVYPRFDTAVVRAVEKEEEEDAWDLQRMKSWLEEMYASKSTAKKGKKSIGLRYLLSCKGSPCNINAYGPQMVTHCLLVAGVGQEMQSGSGRAEVWSNFMQDESQLGQLLDVLRDEPRRVMQQLGAKAGGKIISRGATKEDSFYEDFGPAVLQQYQEKAGAATLFHSEFDRFVDAVDEYFSRIEGQKAEKRMQATKKQATKKLEKVKAQQSRRIEQLKTAEASNVAMAQAVEFHANLVNNALTVVNSAVASGMDWDELSAMVQEEKENENPVALAIHRLDLDKNMVHLSLPSPDVEDMGSDEDATDAVPSSSMIIVPVDLSLTAFQNARAFYQQKKLTSVKKSKATEAMKKAVKQAEKKTVETLEKQQIKFQSNSIRQARKIHWFEKFNWFISSENYLVIFGRDAQQNELLVKRYMRDCDVYVHADVHGAASCVVRNAQRGREIPPLTLQEAGHVCVCRSSAWTSRYVTNAWWVYADQVSKTAPSGEYLTTGSFMIRGKKNFLQPCRLELGFGLLFKLEETCISRHVGERRVRSLEHGSLENNGDGDDDDDDNLVGGHGREGSNSEKVVKLRRRDRKKLRKEAKFAKENGLDEAEEAEEGEKAASGKDSGSDIDIDIDIDNNDVVVDDDDDDDDDGNHKSSDVDDDSKKKKQLVEEDPFAEAPEDMIFQERNYGKGKSGAGAEQQLQTVESAGKDGGQRRRNARLSKRERRNLKMGLPQDARSSQAQRPATGATAATSEDKQQQEKKKLAPKTLRRKRNKLKKREEKYRLQTDEERRIAMELLGNPLPQSEPEKESGKEFQEPPAPASRDWLGKPQKASKNAPSNGTLRGDTKPRDLQPSREDTEGDEMTVFTGIPHPDDLLHFCLPVVAPYSVLSKYKYKVKLTPGSMKRGKASKAAMEQFLRHSAISPREKDLIRFVTDPERVAAIVAHVKVG